MNPRCYVIAATWCDSPVSLHFRALARELAARGQRVILLTDQAKWEVEDSASNPSLRVWPSPRPTHPRDAVFLRRLIHEHRPDCFIANFSAVNIMCTVGWCMRVPCRVAWYHTLSTQLAQDSSAPWWQTKMLRARKRLVYGMATDVVANSEASRKDLREVYGVSSKKCHRWYFSLPDPLANSSYDSTPRTPQDRPPRIICVGRLEHSKGQDLLLRALQKLRRTVPEVSVEFVGRGPCQPELERLAKELGVLDRCAFVGHLPHRDVLQRVASASVAVVPSRSEAFGLVAIEAMSVGTPVVATDVGGLPELLDREREGFLVAPGDVEAMAERIESLLRNQVLRASKSRHARDRFLDKFEQSTVIPRQADWLEELVAKRLAPAAEVTIGAYTWLNACGPELIDGVSIAADVVSKAPIA